MSRIHQNEKIMRASPLSAAHKTTDGTDATVWGKALDCDEFITGSFTIVWTGADQVDGTVTVEASDDPAASEGSFVAETGGVMTIDGAAGTKRVKFTGASFAGRWYRLNYAKGTNSAGSVSAYVELKG